MRSSLVLTPLLSLLLCPHNTEASSIPSPSPQHPQPPSRDPEASAKTPPHPLPLTTAAQSPWKAPSAHVPGQASPQGSWQSTLKQVLAQVVLGSAAIHQPAGPGHDSEESLGNLRSRLPGLVKGLGGVGLDREEDAGKVMASLFADPRAAGTPAWIQTLTQGNGTTGTQSIHTSQQMLRVQNPEVQTQALLTQVFSDVSKGLRSLNLSDASSLNDVISAVMNNSGLMTSLSTEAVQMLAALAGVSDPGELLQSVFPVDPRSSCALDLQSWATALLQGTAWALQMLDATGKVEAGVLTGQLTLVGDYEECVDPLVIGEASGFPAQFCPVTFTSPSALASFLHKQPVTVHLCVPKSCNTKELDALLQPTMHALGSESQEIRCSGRRDPSGDKRFIGVTALLGVLAFLCAVGTAYGVFWDRQKEKQKEKKAGGTETKNDYSSAAFLNNGEKLTGGDMNGKPSNKKALNMPIGSHVNGKLSNEKACDTTHGSDVKGVLTNGEAPDMVHGSHVDGNLTNEVTPNVDVVGDGMPGSYVKCSEGEEKVGMRDVEVGERIKPQNGSGPVVPVHTTVSDSKVSKGSSRPSSEKGVVSELLLNFSVLKNGRKVLSCQQQTHQHQQQSDIACLHGIRVLSIFWVVLGHVFAMLDPVTGNRATTLKMLDRVSFMVIPAGMFAVDTFFLLSGCLSSFLFLRSTRKSGVTVSGVVLYYIHRYWRLTALFAVMLGVYVGIFPYMKEGPFQYALGMDSETTCRHYWHYNLLYINSIVTDSVSKMCFGWSWYLSNDMQFSFLAPLVLIPWALKGSTRKWRILGFVLCGAMILTHCITTAVISYRENVSAFTSMGGENNTYAEKVYLPSWTRIGPYAVGLLLGYSLFATPAKFTPGKLSVSVGWTVATGVALTLVYVQHDGYKVLTAADHGWDSAQNVAYETLDKVLWALCVAWVIFACHTGCGGFVNTLLSWSAWKPLSRLTYGVYLVHLVILFIIGGNLKKPLYLDNWTSTTVFLATTVLSFLVSFTFSMLVEAPALGVEKVLLGKIFRAKK